MPPNFPKTEAAAVNSAKAPPIPTKPLAISSQDMEPIEPRVLATTLHASAISTIANADLIDTFSALPIIFKAPTNSKRANSIAIRPLAILSILSFDISVRALTNIFIAIDIAISANPDCTIPLASNSFRVLVIDLKLETNIANSIPIPSRPVAKSSIFNADIFLKAFANIPMAIAMLTNEAVLIP